MWWQWAFFSFCCDGGGGGEVGRGACAGVIFWLTINFRLSPPPFHFFRLRGGGRGVVFTFWDRSISAKNGLGDLSIPYFFIIRKMYVG